MVQSLKPGCQRFKLLSLSVLGGAIAALIPISPNLAQITPDATLGNESSTVTPSNNIRGFPGLLIQGGAIRGRNLFQSFQDFNVSNGQRVYFANPAGIEAILSRVTGRNPSNIFGLLGVNGTANLFLINPNGIIFGPNARLDIAGSFVATTADSLTFENGLQFSARNPEAPPLLTVTLRPGLPYGTHYQGNITNAGNLAVGAGQTLSLQGDSVTSTGALTTAGGTVQMLGNQVSLLDNARIDVSGIGSGGTVLIGGDFQGNGEVPNASQTFIASGVTIAADGLSPTPYSPLPTPSAGGRVIVWSDNATQFNGTISARGADTGGDGGFVEVSGKQTLGFNGRVDTSAPLGKPGTLLLDPFDFVIDQPITFTAPTTLQADNNITFNAPVTVDVPITVADGPITSLKVEAGNNITFNAPVTLTTFKAGVEAAAGNDIFVNSDITTNGGAVALASNNGVFVKGVTITTNPFENLPNTVSGVIALSGKQQVSVINSNLLSRGNNDRRSSSAVGIVSPEGSVRIDGSTISATNFGTAVAGDVVITARDRVDISNSGIFSRGNEGRIFIGRSEYSGFDFSPGDITISSGSTLETSNDSVPAGASADAGLILVQANGSVEITGSSDLLSRAESEQLGSAGGIGVRSQFFKMTGNSRISTSTFSGGSAGAVLLLIDKDATLDNSNIFSNLSNLSAGSSTSLGFSGFSGLGGTSVDQQAGAILIGAGSLSLLNGSQIQTSVIGSGSSFSNQGSAGDILIATRGTVKVMGTNDKGIPSAIFADVEQDAAGRGGNILIGAKSVQVRDRGRINANNAGTGPAGNVFLFTRAVWLDNRSFITASSADGQGGNIFLSVNGAIILGRNSFVATLALDGATFAEGAGNIAIGSGDLLVEDRLDGKLVPRFTDRTLLLAGKTIRNNDIGAPGIFVDGGFIRVNAFRLQDIAQRPLSRQTNDISAESALGNPGEVVINTLNIFPSLKFNPLPERTPRPQIAQGCDPRIRQETSRFILSGRGGLPPDVGEGLNQDTLVGAPPAGVSTAPVTPSDSSRETAAIASAPARGWIRQPNGTILLTTYVTDPTAPPMPSPLQYRPQPCNVPQP